MTSGPDIGSYDPFEDTGDWPFRDAPPKQDESRVAGEQLPEVEQRSVFEDTELAPAMEEEEPPAAAAAPVSEPTYDDPPAALEMHSEAEPLPEVEPEAAAG